MDHTSPQKALLVLQKYQEKIESPQASSRKSLTLHDALWNEDEDENIDTLLLLHLCT
jgi:hypothetical protein